MKAFYMKDQKQFMNQLLKTDLFDHFLLAEATIHGAVSYHIDGRINPDFFDPDDTAAVPESGAQYLPFSQLRSICYELIRGRRTPLYLKFVFLLSPKNAANTIAAVDTAFGPDDISGIMLNLTFRDGAMVLTTGVSYRTFAPDHSFDEAWDTLAARFLSNHGIEYDIR